MDVLIPLIMEEIVEGVKGVLQERISERISEQVVDAFVPRVVGQVIEVPKILSRDRILQCAADHILDVPCRRWRNSWWKCGRPYPRTEPSSGLWSRSLMLQFRRLWRNWQRSSRFFPRTGFNSVFVEQTIEIPAISLAVKIVEVPVVQTQGKTQQVVNTHVQHVVNAVEAEMPKIIKETLQRKRPIINEKINQETKHIELDKAGDMLVGVQRQMSMAQTVEETMKVQPLQFINKVVDVPVVAQRQIPIAVQTIQKTTDIPQLQCIDKVIDVPVVSVAQAPHVQIVEKTVQSPQMQIAEKTAEIPLLQIVKKTVETPEVQTERCTHTSESMGTATARQVVEIEAYLPAESASSLDTVVDVSVAMQQQAPGTQQVQTTIETSQLQFIDRSVDVPVASLKQVPTMQSSQKPVNVPHVQHIDKVVGVPVVWQRQAPTTQTEQKTAEVPQIQCLELLVNVPVVTQQTAEIPQVPPMDRICHVPVVMQKTVKTPRIQFIDRVVDVPVMAQRQGPSGKKELEEVSADNDDVRARSSCSNHAENMGKSTGAVHQ